VKRGIWLGLLGSSVFSALSTVSTVALADEREQCVAAADQAQDLRDKGQYRRAREQMLVCSRDVCPGAVKRDCTQWLADLETAAPTIVVSAKSGGSDITAVKVSIDGQPLTEKLDGKPMLVDPGEHTLRYETAGSVPKEEKVVIITGQKMRIMTVTFSPDAVVTPPPPPPDAGGDRAPVPIIAYVLGGVGVVGLGAATFFWLSGLGDKSHLEDTCGPKNGKPGFCSQSDVDSARTKLVIGDVSGGIGLVALGAAAYFVIARPKVEAKAQMGWNVDVRPLPGGGAAFVGASF
jgi:hypothetical protein